MMRVGSIDHWLIMKMLRTVLCAPMFLCTTMAIRSQETSAVTIEDTGAVLINPNMGWTMHFYSNVPENYGSKLEPIRHTG